MSETITTAVEVDFGSGWTDITADVRGTLTIDRGYPGSGWSDRVARTGTCSFDLTNASDSSGGLRGYYTPGHDVCRAGWALKVPVRIRRTYNAVTTTRFRGWVSNITPATGQYRTQRVTVTATDWMNEAAEAPVVGLALVDDVRSDEALTPLVALVPRAPSATSYAAGVERFAVALDDLAPSDRVLTGLARVVESEGGYLYVAADGTLTFEHRHQWLTRPVSATLTDADLLDLEVAHGLDEVVNRVDLTVHPRAIADTATVLAQVPTGTPLVVPVFADGGSAGVVAMAADYLDAYARPCAGLDMVAPVAGTDYTANSQADGTGIDLTSYVSVSASYESTRVVWTITNNTDASPAPLPNGGTGSCQVYMTLLQARGRSVSAEDAASVTATDSTSQTAYGLRGASGDLAYVTDPNTAQGWAAWRLAVDKDPRMRARSLMVFPQTSARLMALADLDLGAALSLTEWMSGLEGEPELGALELGVGIPGVYELGAEETEAVTRHYITGIQEVYDGDQAGWLTVTLSLATRPTRTDWFQLDALTLGAADGAGVLGYV